MKTHHFTLLFALLPFLLNAQNIATFSQDTADAHRLFVEARALINNRKSAEAIEKVETAGKLVLRSVGANSADYGTYRHLKGTIEVNLGHFKASIPFLEEALDIRKRILGPEHPETGKTVNNLANAYQGIGDLLGAYYMHRELLSIRERLKPSNPVDIAISCNNLAGMLNYRGEPDSAIYFRTRALSFFENNPAPDQKTNIALIYYNLGTDYYLKGDFRTALDYTRQSLSMRIALLGPDDRDVAFSYSGLANIYAGAADFRSAADYNLQALAISLRAPIPDDAFIAGTWSNLGNNYASLFNLDSAKICHEKALEIRSRSELDASFSYSSIGLVYLNQLNPDKAIEPIRKSLDIRLKVYGENHYLVIRNLNSLAACYAIKKDYDQALQYLERAQKANRFDGQDYDTILAFSELIETLYNKGEIYGFVYEETHSLDALQHSRHAYEQARAVSDFRRNTFTQKGSDTPVKGDQIWDIDEELIGACYQLWISTHDKKYISTAFESAEKSKSWALFESLKEGRALRFAGIDSSILQKEYTLRVDIGMLEKQIATEEAKNNPDTSEHISIVALNGRLIEKRAELNALKKYLAEENSAYYRLKYGDAVASLSELQNDRLKPDQTILEYFVGSFNTYIFLIRQNDAQMVSCPSDSIEWYVRQIRSCIDSSFDSQGMRLKSRYNRLARQYARAAYILHRQLIDCFEKPLALTGQVIIIPDGILGYLPFELLLGKAPADAASFDTHEYFGLHHRISYNYSTTLWREMSRPDSTRYSFQFLGIAPFTEEVASTNLSPLRFSVEEITRIESRFKGNKLIGSQASVSAFQSLAPGARIIHFSTHATVTGRKSTFNSSLEFFPDRNPSPAQTRLFIQDIYSIRLCADMVVLSACDAGIGELERGEGIISLARAFTYAGSKSIVTTLWSVNEASTKDLMIDFYNYLDNGDTKDTALWKAQKRYVELQKGKPTAAHPYWWAGFIPIGNMKKLR
ncbi:MAG: CHAT domain-containing protein [Saprospiraceae bacterium]|nr:CHAT domain-containing protein [Saprospiraceae bacterium]